jgi:hypothetical protein
MNGGSIEQRYTCRILQLLHEWKTQDSIPFNKSPSFEEYDLISKQHTALMCIT